MVKRICFVGKPPKKQHISVLKGARLKLFNNLLDNNLIRIKNKKLIVTNKFMKLIKKELRKRN